MHHWATAPCTLHGVLYLLLTHYMFMYSSVKIHDLAEMKEIYAIITLEDTGGTVQHYLQVFLTHLYNTF